MKIISGITLLLFGLTGCLGESVLKQNKSESITPEKLYREKCGGCHALYEREKYQSEEWRSIIIRMEKKAHLDESQSKLILQYLTDTKMPPKKD